MIDNAGISPKHDGKPAPIWQMTSTEWQRVVNVNLNGAFNLSRLLSVSMVERRFGRIISMSSVAGSAFLPIVAAHYSATKAAIIGLTRHLAGELGEYGITANALAPGRIEPPFLGLFRLRQLTPSSQIRRFEGWDNHGKSRMLRAT